MKNPIQPPSDTLAPATTFDTAEEAVIRQLLRCRNRDCFCYHPDGKVHCPTHRDWTPSLSLSTQNGKTIWTCHAVRASEEHKNVEQSRCPKCSPEEIAKVIQKKLDDQAKSSIPIERAETNLSPRDWYAAVIHRYYTVNKVPYYEVGIWQENEHVQIHYRRRKGSGNWIYNLDARVPVLYNLHLLVEAELIIFCEGEETVNRVNIDLERANLFPRLVATTTPTGWLNIGEVDLSPLYGKNVIIICSPDDSSRKFCTSIAQVVCSGFKSKIRFIELPDVRNGSGYTEFREAGHNLHDLLSLIKAAPIWKPSTKSIGSDYGR